MQFITEYSLFIYNDFLNSIKVHSRNSRMYCVHVMRPYKNTKYSTFYNYDWSYTFNFDPEFIYLWWNINYQMNTLCSSAHEPTFLTCSLVRATVTKEGSLQRRKRKGILFLKLFWPSASKNCSSDWERLEIQGWIQRICQFSEITRAIYTVEIQKNFWNRLFFLTLY